MHSCIKFQASDFGIRFALKNMKEKNSEKLSVKIVISI